MAGGSIIGALFRASVICMLTPYWNSDTDNEPNISDEHVTFDDNFDGNVEFIEDSPFGKFGKLMRSVIILYIYI